MTRVLTYLWDSRTTLFGYLQVVLGVVAATDGVLAPRTLKWIILGNGILTACLGHFNNLQLRKAAAAAPSATGQPSSP